jgi:hypothetical protein
VLKYDYYLSQQKVNNVFPINLDKAFTNECYDFLKSEVLIALEGRTVKQMLKGVRFIEFEFDILNYLKTLTVDPTKQVIMFDYSTLNNVYNEADVIDVTEYLANEE